MTERRDADNIILEIAGTTNRLRYNQNRLNQIISGKIAGERGERDYLEEMIAMHCGNTTGIGLSVLKEGPTMQV